MFQLFMIDFSGFVAEYSAHTSKLKFRIRHIFFLFFFIGAVSDTIIGRWTCGRQIQGGVVYIHIHCRCGSRPKAPAVCVALSH